jgi:glycosyltransferase involved in cell wall biosynthesis
VAPRQRSAETTTQAIDRQFSPEGLAPHLRRLEAAPRASRGMRPIRVLTVLTYYEPHWTGLTAIAKRIATGLAARGHRVTVLTTQHDPELPREDILEGVHVLRLPAVARVSRGMLAPSLPLQARRLVHAHDVVHIHTPLPEAVLVAALSRRYRRPLLMTHQGDLVMPAGFVNQTIQKAGTALLSAAGHLATAVSPLNADYGRNSSFLRPFAHKLVPILPPVEIPAPSQDAALRWRADLGIDGRPVVGFAGRFVEEKGFDYLLRAVPHLLASNAGVRLLYAGDHRIEYEDFYGRCRPLLQRHAEHVRFVGLIRDRQRLADFYAMCDAFVLPSRTDSFAAVQVEAMLCGTPVVATDIPGARVPVSRTRMGVLVEPRSPQALAAGLSAVLEDTARYVRSRKDVEALFDPVASIDAYERLLVSLAERGV